MKEMAELERRREMPKGPKLGATRKHGAGITVDDILLKALEDGPVTVKDIVKPLRKARAHQAKYVARARRSGPRWQRRRSSCVHLQIATSRPCREGTRREGRYQSALPSSAGGRLKTEPSSISASIADYRVTLAQEWASRTEFRLLATREDRRTERRDSQRPVSAGRQSKQLGRQT